MVPTKKWVSLPGPHSSPQELLSDLVRRILVRKPLVHKPPEKRPHLPILDHHPMTIAPRIIALEPIVELERYLARRYLADLPGRPTASLAEAPP